MWPFKGKSKSPALPVLPFKSGRAFWEMQCKYGHTEITPKKKGIIALVVRASRDKETRVQTAELLVASDDGGFEVVAQTPTDKGDDLKPDDVVIWIPFEQNAVMSMMVELDDERSSWLGLIMAKVAPEIDPNNPEFRVVSKFH